MSCPFMKETKESNKLNNEYFFEKFYEQTNILNKKADLRANLVCTRIKINDLDESHEWKINLSEIDGENVVFLLGRKFNRWDTIPLDSLIPIKQQESHYKRVVNILNEGPTSGYWKFLFEGMMSRTVKIINPTDKTPRFVNIFMNMRNYSSIDSSSYTFEVTVRYFYNIFSFYLYIRC